MNALAVGIALALGTGSAGFGAGVAVAALLAPRLGSWARGRWWGPVTLGVVGLGAFAMAMGLPAETSLLGLLAWLFIHRRLVSTGPDRVSFLLVGLILVAASTRSHGLGFLFATLLWVLGVPGSLGISVGRNRWGLALGVGALALPMFWALPRFTGAHIPAEGGRGLIGFAGDVELGAMNELLDDPALVFRAHFSALPDEVPYFRGVALDRFDGHRWTTEATRQREEDWADPRSDLVRVQVQLEAHPEGVLFVPGVVEGIDVSGVAVERDQAGAYHLPGPPRRIEYTVFTSPPYGPGRGDPFRDAQPSLALPPLSAEVRALFQSKVADVDGPDARIAALSQWLRSDYAYTREPRNTDAEAPLERFLLDNREGHCEYFASALAVGGRVIGVPTRVINGFVGGERGGPDEIVFRRYHAHSWVEYYDGDRWVTADATPSIGAPAGPGWVTALTESVDQWWSRAIVEYDAEQQLDAARAVAEVAVPFAPESSWGWIGSILVGLMAGCVLLALRYGALWGLRRFASPRRRAVADPVTRELHRAQGALRKAGFELPDAPDVEVARWVRSTHPEAGSALEELAWLSYEVRFGRADARSRLARASQLLQTVRACVS